MNNSEEQIYKIVIIDDDKEDSEGKKKILEYSNNKIKVECFYDLPQDPKDIEDKYNWNDVDALLIDNDLVEKSKCLYTGPSLSAWFKYKHESIPRIAFTKIKYCGASEDFDYYIEKRDVVIKPEDVAGNIIQIIQEYDPVKKKKEIRDELIKKYGELSDKKLNNDLNNAESQLYDFINEVLDKYDKQLNEKTTLEIEKEKIAHEMRMLELNKLEEVLNKSGIINRGQNNAKDGSRTES